MEKENIKYFINSESKSKSDDCILPGAVFWFITLSYVPKWALFIGLALFLFGCLFVAIGSIFRGEKCREYLYGGIGEIFFSIESLFIGIVMIFSKKFFLYALVVYFLIRGYLNFLHIKIIRSNIKENVYHPRSKESSEKMEFSKRVKELFMGKYFRGKLSILYFCSVLLTGFISGILGWQIKGFSFLENLMASLMIMIGLVMNFTDSLFKGYYAKKYFFGVEGNSEFSENLKESRKKLQNGEELDLDSFIILLSSLDKIQFNYDNKKYEIVWLKKGLEFSEENGRREFYKTGDLFLEKVRIEDKPLEEIVEEIEIIPQ